MNRHAKIALVSLSCLGLAAACSPGRFTKLKKNAPVVLLEPHEDYRGKFGESLAVASTGEEVDLYVGGPDFERGGLMYELGLLESPSEAASDESHCLTTDPEAECRATVTPVGLGVSYVPSGTEERCFVTGVAEINGTIGLFTRCFDGTQFVRRVPEGVGPELFAAEGSQSGVRLAVNRLGDQLLLAATPEQGRAWFYEPLDGVPVEVVPPADVGLAFGNYVAVLSATEEQLLAVAQVRESRVWIYQRSGAASELIGCVSGGDDFGALLAAGDVDGDGVEDLVVSDAEAVHVYSGAVLEAQAPTGTPDCSAEGLSAEALLATLECVETSDVGGCGTSGFPASLAVADVDGDGAGSVFVGAPRMRVREQSSAGAVFVYDKEGELENTLVLSKSKPDKELGTSLAAVVQEGRDIIAAGAAGSREVFLFYCAGGGAAEESERCGAL